VTGAETAWSDAVVQRIDVARTIKPRTTQLLNYILSSTTWKSGQAFRQRDPGHQDAAQAAAAAGPAREEKRERGGQSYPELESNWRGLVNLATGLPGFAPPDVEIQAGTLNGLLSQLRGLNGSIPALEAALGEAQEDRQKAFYDEETGLPDRFQQVKTTVKGQYGVGSSQWEQVKGMKW